MADQFGENVFLWEILGLAVVAVPGLLYLYRRDRSVRGENSVEWFPAVNLFVTGALLSVMFRLIFFLVGDAGYEASTKSLFTGNWPLQILVLLGASPLLEELFFRGVFYTWLKTRVPAVPAILLSAFCFGLYHGNISQGIYGFFMGVLLAMAMERYRTVAAPLVIHIGANAAALILEFLL